MHMDVAVKMKLKQNPREGGVPQNIRTNKALSRILDPSPRFRFFYDKLQQSPLETQMYRSQNLSSTN